MGKWACADHGNIHHSLTVLAYFYHHVGVHTCRRLISSSLPTSCPSSSDTSGENQGLGLEESLGFEKEAIRTQN